MAEQDDVRRRDQEWVSVTDWAALVDAHKRQESELRALNVGHRLLAEQMAENTLALRRQDQQIHQTTEQLNKLLAASSETADTLKDIKDAVTAGRVLRSAGAWLSGLIITLSAAWLAVKDMIFGRGGA